MQNLNDKERQNALNEVRILASIKHPNIIGYKEAFIDDASDSLMYAGHYLELSWSTLLREICIEKSPSWLRTKTSSKSPKCGGYSCRSSKGCECSTASISSTET